MDQDDTEDDRDDHTPLQPGAGPPVRLTLDASVRRRRADRAFYIRLAGSIRQNERALERLAR